MTAMAFREGCATKRLALWRDIEFLSVRQIDFYF